MANKSLFTIFFSFEALSFLTVASINLAALIASALLRCFKSKNYSTDCAEFFI